MNRHFAGKLVQAEALGGRRALAIGYHREALSAIRELSASAPGWQRKGNGGAGDRLMVLLLDTDDGCARGALADIINGAFALHDHDIEFHGERSRV